MTGGQGQPAPVTGARLSLVARPEAARIRHDAPAPGLSRKEFAWIRDFLHARTGILLRDGKEAVVAGRLGRRLRHHGVTRYTDYFRLLEDPESPEARVAVDLLTTNETYFFREPEHFDLLRQVMTGYRPGSRPVRVWSAASSSGEEAYSIAMVLADCLDYDVQWEVLGTDISPSVLERARRGLYPVDAAAKIPRPLLRRYCMRGRDEYDGYLAVRPELAAQVRFGELNLSRPLPDLGTFDVVFLRNVMIYFGVETKRALIEQLERVVRPGGYLLVGHAETLNGMSTRLTMLRPSVYWHPGKRDRDGRGAPG